MPVHVHPENDICDHELTDSCFCGPVVSWVNAWGTPFPNGPLVSHCSLDGREKSGMEKLEAGKAFANEVSLGRWLVTEVEPC